LEAVAAGRNYRRNSVNNVALIGSSVQIKGTVTAREALTIAGKIDGSIDLAGFPLVVTADARITADIIAQTIVVGGDIKGSICAEGHIVVQKTATIEGELSAPSITVEDGAQMQGRFDISGKRAELKLAS
jgi:cytoskeletal protein CcmA (bactofilin family)